MRRYVAALGLAFAAYALGMPGVGADTPATVESCTTDAECVAAECGPGEWSIPDALAGEGCISLTANGEGDLPDCSTPAKVSGNGWCLYPETHPRAAELYAAYPDLAPALEAAQPLPCMEDEPCWDCRTMGNLRCGTDQPAPTPVALAELPHTL